jgi:hypothetical protein
MSTKEQTPFREQINADLERVIYWLEGDGSSRPGNVGVAVAALMQTVERLADKVDQLNEYVEKQARRSY